MTETMTVEEFREKYSVVVKPNKYNNSRVVIDGYKFDSRKEAAHYLDLKVRKHAGDIRDLKVHPRFVLLAAFKDKQGRKHRKVEYVADFSYTECDTDIRVVEDVKGGKATQTALWKLKWKLAIKWCPSLDFRVVDC